MTFDKERRLKPVRSCSRSIHTPLSPHLRRYAQAIGFCLLGCISTVPALADEPLQLSLIDGGTETTARQARGVLRAVDQATLSSDLAGRIAEMPFREGESFKKGDLLVRFDCAIYQAQLEAAQAAARAAQAELNQNRQLAEMRSIGKHAVELSAAHLAQSRSESRVYQVQVNRCRIEAPFDGRVVARHVQVYESVGQGVQLLDIVDNRHLEINLLVPSRWLSRLKPGQPFTFTPDETGTPFDAEVARIGARIDEGSQTLSLIGSISDQSAGLISGMSGTAQFTVIP